MSGSLHLAFRVACSSLGLVALSCAPEITSTTSGAGGSATSASSASSSASTSATSTTGTGAAATPVVLATFGTPWGIAVNATSVVFTSNPNNFVGSVPIGGGDIFPLSNQIGPTAVVLSDGIAWVGLDGGLARVTLDGKSDSLFLATFITHAVAVRAGTVYLSSGPNIESTPFAGGPVQPIAMGSSFVESIAVDDARVYWAASAGQIQSAPLGGGATTTLASFNAVPYGLAVDSTYVYFSTQKQGGASGAIMRAPIDKSSPPETLSAAESQPMQLVLDGSTLYWVDHAGAIRTMPASGGAPTSLYEGDPGPNSIAVDATSVYWSNDATGAITRMAR